MGGSVVYGKKSAVQKNQKPNLAKPELLNSRTGQVGVQSVSLSLGVSRCFLGPIASDKSPFSSRPPASATKLKCCLAAHEGRLHTAIAGNLPPTFARSLPFQGHPTSVLPIVQKTIHGQKL